MNLFHLKHSDKGLGSEDVDLDMPHGCWVFIHRLKRIFDHLESPSNSISGLIAMHKCAWWRKVITIPDGEWSYKGRYTIFWKDLEKASETIFQKWGTKKSKIAGEDE
jgi:hypothetical protein